MRILFFCPFWGLARPYLETFTEPVRPLLEKIKAAGYDGVETHLPFDRAQKKEFWPCSGNTAWP
jgi:hypothetical protein